MTAPLPHQQPSPQQTAQAGAAQAAPGGGWPDSRRGLRQFATGTGRAAAAGTQGVGRQVPAGTTVAAVRPPATGLARFSPRELGRNTANRLNAARAVAAGLCLLPGLVAFGSLSAGDNSTAGTSVALVRADLTREVGNAHVAVNAACAGVGSTDDARVALTDAAGSLGQLELLRPDWSDDIAAERKAVDEAATAVAALPATGTCATPDATSAAATARTDIDKVGTHLPYANDATGNDRRQIVLSLIAAVSLVALAALAIWLARTTHRVVNPGLLAGFLVVLAVMLGGGAVLGGLAASHDVESLASARADAALITAVETDPVTSTSPDARARQADITRRSELNRKAAGTASSVEAAAFTKGQPTFDSSPTPSAIKDRITTQRTLDTSLSREVQHARSTTSMSPTVLGYVFLGLSFLGGAAAWAGISRRLAEYR